MKNIVMLSVILAVVSVPRYLCAKSDLIFSRGYGCLVDSSTGGWQRFYYCGRQNFGCGDEKHNNGDYSVCDDKSELQRGNNSNICYLSHKTKFTTRNGKSYYCCNGTSTSMGTIQKDPCEPPETPKEETQEGETQEEETQASGGGRIGSSTGSSSSGGEGNNNGIVVSNSTGSGSTSLSNSGEGNENPPGGQGTNNGSNGGQWGATNLDAFLGCDTSDIRNGFCPSTNSCVKCPSGKYFNENDSANRCCSYAIGLTKTDMMYGYGKTQNSNPRLRNQCWTIKDIVRYRACVLSGVQKPTTIKVPIQSAMDTAVVNTVSEK